MLLNLNGERILRLREVLFRTCVSRSAIYDLMRKSQFPRQIKLGNRTVGWLDSEITAWISERVSASRRK